MKQSHTEKRSLTNKAHTDEFPRRCACARKVRGFGLVEGEIAPELQIHTKKLIDKLTLKMRLKLRHNVVAIFALLKTFMMFCLLFSSQALAEEISPNTRLELQTTLRAYIIENTVDEKYRFQNDPSDMTNELLLKRIHPVIFRKGDQFMMCADFVSKSNKPILIDYIIIPYAEGYKVEKEIEGRRPYLTTLFERVF